MAAQKFLTIDNTTGRHAEANPTALGGSAAYAGMIPALDGNGTLPSTMLPAGVGADAQSVPFSEAVAASAPVNLWWDTSGTPTLKARNADASVAGKEAHAFAPSAMSAGATGTVTYSGTVGGQTGLTAGAPVFLGTTAGTYTQTPPTTAGQVLQRVGVATGTTQLHFLPLGAVTRA